MYMYSGCDYPYESCLCTFWPCHPYNFTIKFIHVKMTSGIMQVHVMRSPDVARMKRLSEYIYPESTTCTIVCYPTVCIEKNGNKTEYSRLLFLAKVVQFSFALDILSVELHVPFF